MTLTPSELQPDVLVVGGGPAGSTAAGLLALRGFETLLVDRQSFPRPKPCGECLNPGAVRALSNLGLLEDVTALSPSPLLGWDLQEGSGVRVQTRFGAATGIGFGVRRSELDAALLDAARRRGARVRTGIRVMGTTGNIDRGRICIEAHRGRERLAVRPRFVIGADGLRSVLARSLNLIRRAPRLKKVSLTCHVLGPGKSSNGTLVLNSRKTVGLAPVGSDTNLWNATVVIPSRDWRKQPKTTLRELFSAHLAGVGVEWARDCRIVAGPWASGPFDWVTKGSSAPGVLLTGDASGYYDPLTGQGIFRALRSAELAAAAAEGILSGSTSPPRARRQYERELRSLVSPGRRLQRCIEAVVSREWLLGPTLRQLSRSPALATGLITLTGDAGRKSRSEASRHRQWKPLPVSVDI